MCTLLRTYFYASNVTEKVRQTIFNKHLVWPYELEHKCTFTLCVFSDIFAMMCVLF